MWAAPLRERAVARKRAVRNEDNSVVAVSTPGELGLFYFLGTLTGRPARGLADAPSRNGVARGFGSATKWSDEHRQEARRLHAEGGMSWAEIAEKVCGDRRFKSTVQLWLNPPLRRPSDHLRKRPSPQEQRH